MAPEWASFHDSSLSSLQYPGGVRGTEIISTMYVKKKEKNFLLGQCSQLPPDPLGPLPPIGPLGPMEPGGPANIIYINCFLFA